ncbi:MAG TPA: tyrosine-type recombinase/integrase [Pyrinomonadaceae bacterium]|jgi:integrase/recombinase XerD
MEEISRAFTAFEESRELDSLQHFDQRLAHPFIQKSVSDETRRAYQRAIREFFAHVEGLHPIDVTPAHVASYRDRLTARGQRAATISTKLSIIRSFFEYLRAAGTIPLNPASTKLVSPPELPTDPAGRALSPQEVRYLLAGPDRSKAEGARDYALMLVMLRLSLRVAEVTSLRLSSISREGRRWVLKCKIKGGKEETWPLPPDVKTAIDEYLKLDSHRRSVLHSGGPEAYLFQPGTNFRTLVFDKPLSERHVQRIVGRWGDYGQIGHVTPHDLRRTIVTEMLNRGYTYREVQMVTKHKDPKTIMRYDRARDNLDKNPVNEFTYDES